MALTATAINNLKPQDKDKFYADANGLYLRVATSGSKTFLYRSRASGRAVWLLVGKYPLISLADARRKALELATGRLPTHITLQTAYDEWYRLSIQKDYKSPLQVKQRLDKHLIPDLGGQRVADITRTQLSSLLIKIAETAPVQANRVLTDIKLLFSYCVERGWLDESPAEKLTQRLSGGRETSRSRYMELSEITSLIQILKSDRFHDKSRWALLILLTTGQRSGEVRGICKFEVSNGTWTIPPERTKNGDEQRVYLPLALRFLMAKMFDDLGDRPFDGMAGQALARVMKRIGFDPYVVPHDLRRTMATHMAGMGVMPHVVEKCLNHRMEGVMAIYNRAEYAAEKKAAWRLWAKCLLRQRKTPEVIEG